MKEYSVRVFDSVVWVECDTIKEARRENAAARMSGMHTVIVHNASGEIIDDDSPIPITAGRGSKLPGC